MILHRRAGNARTAAWQELASCKTLAFKILCLWGQP